MRDNMLKFLLLLGIALLISAVVVTGGFGADDEQTCPEGQTLQAFDTKAGKDTLHAEQPNLPPGYTVEDTVSGSGTDYSVTSDGDSATIKSNGPVELKVACG